MKMTTRTPIEVLENQLSNAIKQRDWNALRIQDLETEITDIKFDDIAVYKMIDDLEKAIITLKVAEDGL